MMFQVNFEVGNMDRLGIRGMEVGRDSQGNTFDIVHHYFLDIKLLYDHIKYQILN